MQRPDCVKVPGGWDELRTASADWLDGLGRVANGVTIRAEPHSTNN
jgi:hypothetical protein